MILIMLLTNGWFASMIPAGIELYYIISGIFTAGMQTLNYMKEVKSIKMAKA